MKCTVKELKEKKEHYIHEMRITIQLEIIKSNQAKILELNKTSEIKT